MIGYAPMAVSYVLRTKGKQKALLLLVALSAVQFIEGRRAGLVLMVVGGILVVYAQRFRLKQFLNITIIAVTFVVVLSLPVVEDITKSASPRIHELVYSPEDIQSTDPSFTVRQAMLRKGLSIFEERPLLGVGLNNFAKYDAAISFDFAGSGRIHGKDISKTSSHNSYISLLSEGGIVLITPVVILELVILLFFLTQYNHLPNETPPIFVGLVGILIHGFFISALMTVFAWYLIGLTAASLYRESSKREGHLR
jgi:O-antigen ligase